jgi:cytochrome c oxidase subunit 2
VNLLATTSQYGYWTPPLYSQHGGKIDDLITTVHVFMLLIFIPWGVVMTYWLIKFRQREGHRAIYVPIKAKLSKVGEVAVIVVEAFLLLFMSMPVWAKYKNDPPPESQRTEVRVIGEQYQWNFHFPGKDGIFGKTDSKLISASNPIGLVESDPAAADDIVKVNELHLPVGKPIYLRLTSKDVIHSFSIPTMRVKQDVIPGMEIPIWFTINESATSDVLREQMTNTYEVAGMDWYKVRHMIAAEDYKSRGGEVVLAKGAGMGDDMKAGGELIENLRKAGVSSVRLQPRTPTEVVCAQLCGNSHFKMKAQLTTQTEAEYKKWMEEAGKKQEMKVDF